MVRGAPVRGLWPPLTCYLPPLDRLDALSSSSEAVGQQKNLEYRRQAHIFCRARARRRTRRHTDALCRWICADGTEEEACRLSTDGQSSLEDFSRTWRARISRIRGR